MTINEYEALSLAWVEQHKGDIVQYLRDFADDCDEGRPGGHTALLNYTADYILDLERQLKEQS